MAIDMASGAWLQPLRAQPAQRVSIPRQAAADHVPITSTTPPRDLDPSPLDAMHKGFDPFIAHRRAGAKVPDDGGKSRHVQDFSCEPG
jgi:hypothetical protein